MSETISYDSPEVLALKRPGPPGTRFKLGMVEFLRKHGIRIEAFSRPLRMTMKGEPIVMVRVHQYKVTAPMEPGCDIMRPLIITDTLTGAFHCAIHHLRGTP